MKTLNIIFSALAVLLFCACGGGGGTTFSDSPGDTIQMRHARHLCMVERGGEIEVCIRNPWDTTKILQRYILTTERTNSADEVQVPLQNAAVFTTVHCALIRELGVADAIGGVCDLQYCTLPFVKESVAAGSIVDLGNSTNPGIEQIMELQPDAILLSPFEDAGGYGRLERMGIPIIECADYMENTPLGRAEWMRFYGRLFGQAQRADSLFDVIEQEYIMLAQSAAQTSTRPQLLVEIPQSGRWILPGGKSTTGQIYRDAGAEYLFRDLPNTGSNALSIEHVLERAQQADVWLIKHYGTLTRRQIFADTPLLRCLTMPTYLCNTRENGFFDEAPFHPEQHLRSLIHILHPELGIEPQKKYYTPLE